MAEAIPQLIDSEWCGSRSRELIEVTGLATQDTLALMPKATAGKVEQAITSAQRAFGTWREAPVPERARLVLRYQHLFKEHHDEPGGLLARETGKNLADAKSDVRHDIEVVEHAANVASLMVGETVENVAHEIDTVSWIRPLSVCARITPFSFPVTIPPRIFPLAIVCGNTFTLKPSEWNPLTPNRLAKLFLEAGMSEGVLQVVRGGHEQVDALLTHPDTQVIFFVGSVAVGQHMYHAGTAHLERMQTFAGAKNHMVILPDANRTQALGNLVGTSCGAAGQRYMATSTAVLINAAREQIPELTERVTTLRPGHWRDPDAACGLLTSPQVRQRVLRLIAEGKAEGAEYLLNGSQCQVEGYPNGNWLGPTLFRAVMPKMGLYREEIFDPMLVCLEVDTLGETIALVNANPYGNGTSLFTRSSGAARRYRHAVQVGQVGVSVPIPVPLPSFSFTGWKGSFCGDLHAYGKQMVCFYTEVKTVTSR